MKVYMKDGFEVVEFMSISEFCNYLDKTPVNNAFKNAVLFSSKKSYERTRFTGTESLEQAEQLLRYGWKEGAEKLNKGLTNVIKNSEGQLSKRRNIYDVSGFQCCVPRYLQGVPDSMVRSKIVTVKNKTVTIDKDITFEGYVSPDYIIECGVKTLSLIYKLESQGIKVNLNIVCTSCESEYRNMFKIRVKNSNERLNVSKMAFILAHPSMGRRFSFAFTEKYPNFTKKFVGGYGGVAGPFIVKKLCTNKSEASREYFVPNNLNIPLEKIESLEDLEKYI